MGHSLVLLRIERSAAQSLRTVLNSKPAAMGVDLYYMDLSAPCRSVMLLAKAIGLELNLKVTDIMAGETRTPEFIKMNPQHCLPTMDDDGFKLWESRAILSYLASKYGPAHLYPSDPKERAVVDQRLYFDMGTLYERFGKCVYPLMFGDGKIADNALDNLKEALGWLEGFFGDNQFVAGPKQTVADFAIASTVATIEACELVDLAAYPKLSAWLAACKTDMPGYAELNGQGATAFGGFYKAKLNA